MIPGQVTPGIDFGLEFDIFIDLLFQHLPNGIFKTWYGVYFFGFENFDPQSIVSIVLSDPSGNPMYSYTREDGDQDGLEYIDQYKGFFNYTPGGEPELGEYTFTIVADGFNAVAKKSKTINRVMPIPDAALMLPANGAILTSKTPTFQWGAIQNPDAPVFYRLQIYDDTGYRVFASGRKSDLLSMAIPVGILKPGKTYTWSVGTFDLEDGNLSENKGNSETFTFTMANTLSHSNIPALDIDGWGATTYRSSDFNSTI